MSDEQVSRRKPGPKPKGGVAMSGAERTRLYRQRKRAQQQAEAMSPVQFGQVRDEYGLTEESRVMLAIMAVKVSLTSAYQAAGWWQVKCREGASEDKGLGYAREVERETMRAVRCLKELADLLPLSDEQMSRTDWNYP